MPSLSTGIPANRLVESTMPYLASRKNQHLRQNIAHIFCRRFFAKVADFYESGCSALVIQASCSVRTKP